MPDTLISGYLMEMDTHSNYRAGHIAVIWLSILCSIAGTLSFSCLFLSSTAPDLPTTIAAGIMIVFFLLFMLWFLFHLKRGFPAAQFSLSANEATLQYGGKKYSVDLSRPHFISIVKLSFSEGKSSSFDSPFYLLSSNPFSPSLYNENKRWHLTIFRRLPRHSAILIPLVGRTSAWFSSQYGILEIPEYPKAAYVRTITDHTS